MSKQTWNKLVRDRITEIITSKGEKCITRELSDKEFVEELLIKLKEEADEVRGAKNDLTERKKSRGGFSKKIFLESTENN